MDASVRDQLKAQYPTEKLFVVASPDDGIEIVVKGADPASYLKYRTMALDLSDTVKRSQAPEFLCSAMLVWPEREAFRKDLETKKKTGFYVSIAPKLNEICGVKENVSAGEL